MNHSAQFIFSVSLAAIISGCGFHKSLNMYAHSTVGLNVDRSPPSVRVGITRDEKVMTPMFAGGQKPNVAAGFNASYDPAKRLLFGVSTFFTGGQAATDLTDCSFRSSGAGKPTQCPPPLPQTPEQQYKDGTIICLNDRPKAPNYEKWPLFKLLSFDDAEYPIEHAAINTDKEPSQSKHFIFTSDTTFGFKATWTGSDMFPNKLDAGFNRKEFAHVPFILKERATNSTSDGCPSEAKYLLKIPSFFAYVNEADVKDFAPTKERSVLEQSFDLVRFGYNQVFATGKAAENLARDPDMQENFRRIFMEGAQNAALEKSEASQATQ